MIDKEISLAKRLYDCYSKAVSEQNSLVRLLDQYRRAIIDTRELMQEADIMTICTVCANEGAGCCFQGPEECDPILRPLNLLKMPREH